MTKQEAPTWELDFESVPFKRLVIFANSADFLLQRLSTDSDCGLGYANLDLELMLLDGMENSNNRATDYA